MKLVSPEEQFEPPPPRQFLPAVMITEKKQVAKIKVITEFEDIPAIEKSKEDVYRYMDQVLDGLDEL